MTALNNNHSKVVAVQSALQEKATAKRAETSRRFFKTGHGEYGEGDEFIGVNVPDSRAIARQFYREISLSELAHLLESKIHEERQNALEMLVMQYEKAKTLEEKTAIKDFYLNHLKHVNNWDLVDGSAPYILGDFLLKQDRSVLFKLADSKTLWGRRIAIIATYAFIQNNDFADTLALAEKLLSDTHDLMHKAVGWMLREVGKRDAETLRNFLKKHAKHMPRTALRYAIERFTKEERMKWMKMKSL